MFGARTKATAVELFLHVVQCMYRQGIQFTCGHVHTQTGETVYTWPRACTQPGSHSLHMAMSMHTGKKPQFTYGRVHAHRQRATVYIWPCACTQAGSHILHVVMCMHIGRKPQFTYGHVHTHRHRATVYIWSCACTQAGSHSLHMAMCMHKGKELEFTCGHVYVKAACTGGGQKSLQGK